MAADILCIWINFDVILRHLTQAFRNIDAKEGYLYLSVLLMKHSHVFCVG